MVVSLNDISSEIRAELRSILRQRDDLRKPIDRFGEAYFCSEDIPKYYVLFDDNPRLVVTGLRLGGCPQISTPDERIRDRVLRFAESVWHLKDRLKLWVEAKGISFNVEKKRQKVTT